MVKGFFGGGNFCFLFEVDEERTVNAVGIFSGEIWEDAAPRKIGACQLETDAALLGFFNVIVLLTMTHEWSKLSAFIRIPKLEAVFLPSASLRLHSLTSSHSSDSLSMTKSSSASTQPCDKTTENQSPMRMAFTQIFGRRIITNLTPNCNADMRMDGKRNHTASVTIFLTKSQNPTQGSYQK